MNLAGSKTVSEQEESSISITQNPLWTSIRSTSGLSSPSEISHISDNLSELSDIELKPTQPSYPLSTHLYTHPLSTTTDNLQSVLSNTSAILFTQPTLNTYTKDDSFIIIHCTTSVTDADTWKEECTNYF